MPSTLPVNVSLSAPPITFSSVVPDDRISVSPAFTTCAAAFDKSTATERVVVVWKSSVSIPPPDSLIVSVPSARSVSNTYVSSPPPPVNLSFPLKPVRLLARLFPVNVSLSAPPITFSKALLSDRISVSPAFTTCAAAYDKSIATERVVVVWKSSVSIPPPDSLTVSVPNARSASNT